MSLGVKQSNLTKQGYERKTIYLNTTTIKGA